ncbi:unnamed protein product [[Candida] boidinii]|uniref:Unnamed protein product n=1 Tax=Candida boidinii TaxID=5477 RepID=A0ACB5TSF5_CANBO|nr:unnamed protein product [[Candida] boidinii]
MSSLKAASDGIVQQVIDANRKYHEGELNDDDDEIKMELLESSAKAVSDELHSKKREISNEEEQEQEEGEEEILQEDRKPFNDELNIETEFLLANPDSNSNGIMSKDKHNDDDDDEKN